jgi:hypothetical protein
MRCSQNRWRENREHGHEFPEVKKGHLRNFSGLCPPKVASATEGGFRQNPIEFPPSTGSTTPVTYFAASEAK